MLDRRWGDQLRDAGAGSGRNDDDAVASRAHGADVVSGLDMLVHQAAAQVELFTGARPPLDVMFEAARTAAAS